MWTAQAQELLIDQSVQHLAAGARVDIPEAARLRHREPQPRHLHVFAMNALQESGVVDGVNALGHGSRSFLPCVLSLQDVQRNGYGCTERTRVADHAFIPMVLRCWAAGLHKAFGQHFDDAMATPIARRWFASAPEHRRDVRVEPAIPIPVTRRGEPATVALGGVTEPLALASCEQNGFHGGDSPS